MSKILIDEATVKLALEAIKECHYYMLDTGLPNQSMLNRAFTAHKALAEAPQAQPAPVQELEEYDAGLLAAAGGGDVEWWWDYIRAELGRAYEHYQSQMTPPQAQPAPMLQPNRVISYAAAMKLRELGYEWMNDEWKHLDEPVAQHRDLHSHMMVVAHRAAAIRARGNT